MASVMTSYFKELLVNPQFATSERSSGKLEGGCIYGRWEAGFRNEGLHVIKICTKNFDYTRTIRKSHPAERKIQCFHQNLEDAVLKGESILRESTLSHARRLSEVNKANANGFVAPPLNSENDVLLTHYIPVNVMLPLDVISKDNKVVNVNLLHANLRALKAAHVDGLMVDVWWGIVERTGPKQYHWSAYQSLFQLVQKYGFKLQVIMSFHQCGGNVGDSCYITLPEWVLKEGEANSDIFFTDRAGTRNQEYLSFGVDDKPVLDGRTAVEVYSDFMTSFRQHMSEFLEADVISEVEVGLGPAGELRYPSFPESQGWRFPGIGEFQCYDKYLLSDLKQAANTIGHHEWGYSGPQDAGHYNDWPQSTGFFCNNGSYTTDYGKFFLEWYSGVLLKHGDMILEAASNVFAGCKVKLAAKVAGIHWWYNSRNHAAELAAGYYNLRERDGYKPIAKMLGWHRAVLNFTCIEMRDNEHNWEARCGPEGLTRQVLNAGWHEGIDISCENALPRYDRAAFDQILKNARPDGINIDTASQRRIYSFTYLRLGQDLMQENNWREFNLFVKHMHAGLDYYPEPENYFHPRVPIQPTKLLEAAQLKPALPVTSVALDQCDAPVPLSKKAESFFSQDAPGGRLALRVGEALAWFPFNIVTWLWGRRQGGDQSAKRDDEPGLDDDATHDDDFPGFLL